MSVPQMLARSTLRSTSESFCSEGMGILSRAHFPSPPNTIACIVLLTRKPPANVVQPLHRIPQPAQPHAQRSLDVPLDGRAFSSLAAARPKCPDLDAGANSPQTQGKFRRNRGRTMLVPGERNGVSLGDHFPGAPCER